MTHMTHDALEVWRVGSVVLAAVFYMFYATFCIMSVNNRIERLLAIAVFLLGAITIQLVH